MVDVLDDDRRARRCDPAREALADGDSDALLDLLLQPAGGAGDQHLLVFVEQEDGNRIHVQEALDPQQVVDEQLVERALGPLDVFGRRAPRAGLLAPHPVLHARHGIGGSTATIRPKPGARAGRRRAPACADPGRPATRATRRARHPARPRRLQHLLSSPRRVDVDDPSVVRVLLTPNEGRSLEALHGPGHRRGTDAFRLGELPESDRAAEDDDGESGKRRPAQAGGRVLTSDTPQDVDRCGMEAVGEVDCA